MSSAKHPMPTTNRVYEISSVGSYKSLVVKERPIAKLRPTEVLVKIHAVSLQYRDLMISKNVYVLPVSDGLVPCSDMAGEVISVGDDVKEWKAGHRVCANFSLDRLSGPIDVEEQKAALGGGKTDGVLSEYRIFPAHGLVEIPAHLSYEEASTLPCAALTAYNALYGPVPLRAGDYVLLLGTGGVSIHGLQISLAAGATPIITSSSDDKLDIAKKLGAKHVVNYRTVPNWEEEVLKITNGRGVDHVLEVGGPSTVQKSIRTLKPEGNLHIIGGVANKEPEQNSLYWDILTHSATVRGVLIGSVALFKEMNRLITANPEVTRPLIDKVFKFEEAIDAYAYLESQKHVGKVIIRVA